MVMMTCDNNHVDNDAIIIAMTMMMTILVVMMKIDDSDHLHVFDCSKSISFH